MGIVPGGATPASFMSYGVARRFSQDGDKFGTGKVEGVVAPETAAHAAGTSALLPMLTLGVPGSPTAAVLLGGLLIWGLQPGPLLFVEQKDFVWGLIASMYLGNIAGLIVVLTCVPLFAAILRMPFSVIAPVIMVICAIGAYTVHNSMFDVWMMVVFGVARLHVQEAQLSARAAGAGDRARRRAEASFRQAMLVSQGDMAMFFSNALVGSLTGLALFLLFWPLVSLLRSRECAGELAPFRLAELLLQPRERLGREVQVGGELFLRDAAGELRVLALEARQAAGRVEQVQRDGVRHHLATSASSPRIRSAP